MTNTTTASKYMPKRPRICINGNPPFRPHIIKISKTVLYEVNLTSQFSHLEVLLITNLGLKGGFQIMQILGLLDMCTAVVFVTNSSLLFGLAMAILCIGNFFTELFFGFGLKTIY